MTYWQNPPACKGCYELHAEVADLRDLLSKALAYVATSATYGPNNEGAWHLSEDIRHALQNERMRSKAEYIPMLSASDAACYHWPDDTPEHRALRAAYVRGAVDYGDSQQSERDK